eukprot:scaffold92278_cov62-Phaeocystis_antarctica.AAC.3
MPTCLLAHVRTCLSTYFLTYSRDHKGARDDAAMDGEGGEGGEAGPPPPERLLLLTGPNASGKTVYLRTMALITYLAHVGSFVPAEAATVGLTLT